MNAADGGVSNVSKSTSPARSASPLLLSSSYFSPHLHRHLPQPRRSNGEQLKLVEAHLSPPSERERHSGGGGDARRQSRQRQEQGVSNAKAQTYGLCFRCTGFKLVLTAGRLQGTSRIPRAPASLTFQLSFRLPHLCERAHTSVWLVFAGLVAVGCCCACLDARAHTHVTRRGTAYKTFSRGGNSIR